MALAAFNTGEGTIVGKLSELTVNVKRILGERADTNNVSSESLPTLTHSAATGVDSPTSRRVKLNTHTITKST
jgi:hypothetical protein